VSDPEHSRKHGLLCLRLQAECMQLAADARSPAWQSHFVRAADIWSNLAERGLGTDTGRIFLDDKARST
jgi:hypothetical protein